MNAWDHNIKDCIRSAKNIDTLSVGSKYREHFGYNLVERSRIAWL